MSIDISSIGGVVGEIRDEGFEEIAENVYTDILTVNKLTRIMNGTNFVTNMLRSTSLSSTTLVYQNNIADAIEALFPLNVYNLSDCLASMCHGASISNVSKFVTKKKLGLFKYSDASLTSNLINKVNTIYKNIVILCTYDQDTVTSIINMLTGFKPNINSANKITKLITGYSDLDPDDCDQGFGLSILTDTVSGLNTELMDSIQGSTKKAILNCTGLLYKKLKYAPGMIYQIKSLDDDLDQVKEMDIHQYLYTEIMLANARYNTRITSLNNLYSESVSDGVSDLVCRHLFNAIAYVKSAYAQMKIIESKMQSTVSLLSD